jgi:hypothetical protein
MPDPVVPSLAAARERTVETLTAFFAGDDLSLAELERRLELVYASQSVAELDALTADLRSAVVRASSAGAVAAEALEARTVVSTIFGDASREGAWTVPPFIDVRAAAGSVTIDLTSAVLPRVAAIEIDLRAMFASVRIIVPPGMRVVRRLGAHFARVGEEHVDLSPMDQSLPVVVLGGWAFMAGVRIAVQDPAVRP